MFTTAIVAAGGIYIWAATRGIRPLVYLLKPGSMALIIAMAALGLKDFPAPAYGWLLLAGLVVSTAGDIFLMLPQDRFREGLLSFLVAHLLYMAAMWGGLSTRLMPADILTAVVLGAIWWMMVSRLWQGLRAKELHRLIVPVGVYAAVISAMAWRALGLLWQPGPLPVPAPLVALGAVLFLVSDMALAWDKFVRPLPWRHAIVMATYFGAQYCFAATVAFAASGHI